MMLIWKIFVTITCMVSLTLQMNPLNTASSSGSSQFTDPGSPWFEDTQSGKHYPHFHKSCKIFFQGTNSYNCHAFIRLYCGTQSDDDVTSDDCAKQGIFLFSETGFDINDRRKDPHFLVYHFFLNFPLAAGAFQLPEEFCLAKDSDRGNIYSRCLEVLHIYQDKVRGQIVDSVAKNAVLLRIAKYAHRFRDLFKIQKGREANNLTSEEDFETEYLIHISEHVSSGDANYTPFTFCDDSKRRLMNYKYSDILTNHLKLNEETDV